MAQFETRIYARVVVGEIVVDCEAPMHAAGNAEHAVKMMRACADEAERLLIQKQKGDE